MSCAVGVSPKCWSTDSEQIPSDRIDRVSGRDPSDVGAHDVSEELLRFEQLISDISASFLALQPGEVDRAVEHAVARLRIFFGADRAAILTVTDDQLVVKVRWASYGDGVSGVDPDLNLVGVFPWSWHTLLVERRPVRVSSPAQLPPEATAEREAWKQLPIHAALTLPIVTGGAVGHLIVLNNTHREREWPDQYLPRLRVLGEMMVAAIERERAFDAVRQSEERLREHATRLSAAVETAELGFSEFGNAGGLPPVYDERLRALFGLEPGDERQMPALWLSRIDQAERDQVRELHRQLLSGELERTTVEYPFEHPLRGRIWLRHSMRRTYVAPGTKSGVRLVGAVQDITEQRNREEALRAAHEEVKDLRDRLERENVYLRKEARQQSGGDLIAGRSPAIRRALGLAAQVAPTASTVLLIGETGTGKERFASYLHAASPRRSRHMVRVNCSAIPSALIESELFGREKGAYTGAASKQIGRFELAHGSTLFLDEIGDLPLDVQIKLLRVLQERRLERLGSPEPVDVDVRIIAATNQDLEAAVRAGTFRSDLYYRLNVFPITVPPLRERREDIPVLAEELVEELGTIMRKRFQSIDRASLEALCACEWPGNVRELRNVLERAMILGSGPTLQVAAADLSAAAPAIPLAGVRAQAGSRDLHDLEREHILHVLQDTGWRIRGKHAAAEILGLKPTTLEARMAKLGIRRPVTHQAK
jgi:formate hydrogenlyase transcriptional activator